MWYSSGVAYIVHVFTYVNRLRRCTFTRKKTIKEMYGTCVIMGQSNDYKLYVVTWSLIMHACEASSNNFKGGQAGTHACMMHGTLFTCLCLPVVQSVCTIIIQLGQRQYTASMQGPHQSDRRPKRTHGLKCARAHTLSFKKKRKKEIHAYYFKEK